ncbi:MAG: B12-binding domain-containing radical SAM protein [Bacteroidetes bacterium]|nr:MAG: B12-binding domain-containing radical SAM protein [Bacteroidota bacterium]
MKKVLFSHSYFLRFDPKQWKIQQAYPPLATLYAAAALKRLNYQVELFDPMFSESPDEIIPLLEKMKPDFFVVYDDGFNYLTKMCLTNMREAAFRMVHLAKEKGITAIVSSSDSTDHPDLYLDAGADFIIYGEGEKTLEELLEALQKGNQNFKEINGLIFRDNNKPYKTAKRDVMKDMDQLPGPAWDLIRMDDYKNRWMASHGYFSLNISTTRGCPFHCNWCAKPIYGNRYSVHSPDRIAKEMQYLQKNFSVNHFWITDDIFGLKPGWIAEFAKATKINKFRYKIQSRVDLLLQENTIEALAESGCETVWMGAESGSQKILDAMEKGTTVSQIHEASNLLKKKGIKPAFFLQFGYPGETKEDIEKTLDMVMTLLPDDIGISVSYPLPGTKFYEKVKNELVKKSNWTDSDDLAMMFKNTYPAAYYKLLQRFVHRKYRTKQGMEELVTIMKRPAKLNFSSLKRIVSVPFHYSGSIYYKSKMDKMLQAIPD